MTEHPERRSSKDVRVYSYSESLLTRHWGVERHSYAEGILNLGLIHLALIPLALLVREFYSPGSNVRHFEGLYYLLGGPTEIALTALVLLLEFLISFAIYYIFQAWAVCYRKVGRIATGVFLLLLLGFIIVYRYMLYTYMLSNDFPPAARFTCFVQQLVLIFKWISFVCENGRKVVYPWHKEDETGPAVWYEGQMEPQIGSFSSYVFFIFCPVLLYRDRYPRKKRKPYKALLYFFTFAMFVWVSYVILFEFGLPQSMRREEIMKVAMQNLFLGFIFLACAHTFFIHCWMNGWAELVGFADRNFYEEWWNTRDLAEFLRKWNPIMSDWLKAYFYQPLKICGCPKKIASLVILIVSAFEHDLLLSAGFGYFMPVYLVEYGICGVLLFLKPNLRQWTDQMIMCFALSVGIGLQMTIYCTEVAAMIHCPNSETSRYGLGLIECYSHFNS